MAARFGAPVAMVNAVGNDAYGAAHMENFVKEKIDTTWMRTVEESSGVAPIWSPVTAGRSSSFCSAPPNPERPNNWPGGSTMVLPA
jgi:sugar/nucleoside kinase (ribokinase family)